MIRLTVFSNEQCDSLTGRPEPLTKTFSLDANGAPQTITAAHLTTGRAERREVSSITEFATLLQTLGAHQALTYGVIEQSDAQVVTKTELRNHPGAIARDREHVRWPDGPAIMFIDYDPPKDGTVPMSVEQIRAHLVEVCPELSGAPMVVTASTSAFIYNGEQQLSGARGWHFYVAVKNGTDIERAGKALFDRLWVAGHGRYDISKSAQLLDRSLIDVAVYQPERLDFSGARCIEPLNQRKPPPLIWNADAPLFDTRLIADPTVEQMTAIAEKRTEARAAVEPERRKIRDAVVVQRSEALRAKGIDPIIAQRTAECAVDSGVLCGDFELQTEAGRIVTVGEILAHRTEFHATRFRDPLEPNYHGDRRIAYANLFGGGRPYIWSHAHGGRRYQLYPQSRTLKIERGEQPRLVDEILAVMRIAGDVYDQSLGDGTYRLVGVHEGRIVGMSEAHLRNYIGRLLRCVKYDKRSKAWEPADVPPDLVAAVIAEPRHGALPILDAITRDPTMRPDGSILDKPGYSERDRVLFESDDLEQARIPESPTDAVIRAAFKVLWKAFERFPFVDENARAAMVAALLTAVVRAMLDTSPGFLFEAPTSGSGKSLLQKCIYTLATGEPAVADTLPSKDEEVKKFLHSALRGGTRCIALDNIVNPIYGESGLCSFLTAPIYSSRILGISRNEAFPNRALMILSGNNPHIDGDACRRILRVGIDAQMETPSMRSFDLEPESYVRNHRRELWTAALTILRGFYSLGAPNQTPGSVAGSFETWDRMIRQCVIWLGRSGLVDVALGDPYRSAIDNVSADPKTEIVLNVLRGWREAFGNSYKSPSEALSAKMFAPTFRDAIEAIDDKLTAVRFGHWLRKHKNQIVGGLCIVTSRNSDTKNLVYAVLPVKSTLDPAVLPADCFTNNPDILAIACRVEGTAAAGLI